MRPHRLKKVHEVVLCGWPNTTFNPMILKHFPKMRSFRMEYGQMIEMENDFPRLNHLQV